VQAWWLWLIIAAALAIIGLILWLIHAYLKNKRKKFGMKRHMKSFMDTFDA
jgi:FtsZ-interacting cell division protein ZipA